MSWSGSFTGQIFGRFYVLRSFKPLWDTHAIRMELICRKSDILRGAGLWPLWPCCAWPTSRWQQRKRPSLCWKTIFSWTIHNPTQNNQALPKNNLPGPGWHSCQRKIRKMRKCETKATKTMTAIWPHRKRRCTRIVETYLKYHSLKHL